MRACVHPVTIPSTNQRRRRRARLQSLIKDRHPLLGTQQPSVEHAGTPTRQAITTRHGDAAGLDPPRRHARLVISQAPETPDLRSPPHQKMPPKTTPRSHVDHDGHCQKRPSWLARPLIGFGCARKPTSRARCTCPSVCSEHLACPARQTFAAVAVTHLLLGLHHLRSSSLMRKLSPFTITCNVHATLLGLPSLFSPPA